MKEYVKMFCKVFTWVSLKMFTFFIFFLYNQLSQLNTKGKEVGVKALADASVKNPSFLIDYYKEDCINSYIEKKL